ncbi:MAG: hypothetical protein K2H52_00700 [Lachnospiraceae bacterium]|nr:hypothetical protein [Lachnospiraceae bacterium]MDE6186013.1 hypothetical protein [Lachnospiraceae bacterium]
MYRHGRERCTGAGGDEAAWIEAGLWQDAVGEDNGIWVRRLFHLCKSRLRIGFH